jgi:hypothetical protein
MYAIKAVFKDRANGAWSAKAYTYICKGSRPDKGSILLVPAGDFYSIVKVIGYEHLDNLRKDITYKEIVADLTNSIKVFEAMQK